MKSNLLLVVLALLGPTFSATADTELAFLSPESWDAYAPLGKKVDAIYGDIARHNDQLVAVVALPVLGRTANTIARDVGGGIIDLTRREEQSDQFTFRFE